MINDDLAEAYQSLGTCFERAQMALEAEIAKVRAQELPSALQDYTPLQGYRPATSQELGLADIVRNN